MRNKYDSISDDDRRRIIEAHLAGQSSLLIEKALGIKRTTINTIITKFVEEGRVEAKKRGGRKAHKLSDDQKLIVKSWAAGERGISLAKLKDKCLTTFGVAVSEATISRLLRAPDIRRIKQADHVEEPILPRAQVATDAASLEAELTRLYAQSFIQFLANIQFLNQQTSLIQMGLNQSS